MIFCLTIPDEDEVQFESITTDHLYTWCSRGCRLDPTREKEVFINQIHQLHAVSRTQQYPAVCGIEREADLIQFCLDTEKAF